MASKVLVFGEILYDLFEEKAEIGGAPFSFAAHLVSMGNEADLVSAVGRDAMGYMADNELSKRGVGARYVSKTELPTGYSKVHFENGKPEYELMNGVAYDHIPLPQIEGNYDALYFGTLAQRSSLSQNTLFSLLERDYREVFLDVNVRTPYCTRELLETSLSKATLVKITREEAFMIMPYESPDDYCKALLARFPNVKQVLLTFGPDGSLIYDREKGLFKSEKPTSIPVSTVGAGDAFSACYLHHHLKGDDIPTCISAATTLSDFVVTKLGALPELPEELLKRVI